MKHVEELIIRHFSDDDLSTSERGELREHLRECEACRDQYDQVAEVMRASAQTDEPTRQEMGAWRRGLEETLDAPAVEAEPARKGWLAGGLLARLAPGLALMAVVAAVVAVVVVPDDPREGPGGVPKVQYRGTPDAARGQTPVKPPTLVNLELHAVSTATGVPVPRRLDRGGAVYLDEYLQVSRVCSRVALKYIYVLAMGKALTPLDYFPRPSANESVGITECSTTPRAVGRSIRLAKRHAAGPLWILALYSETPLTREHVHGIIGKARAAGARADGTLAAAVGNMPFGDGVLSVVRRLVVMDKRK